VRTSLTWTLVLGRAWVSRTRSPTG